MCILNLCQTAVYFRGDSCYWDSIPDFFKCHRKKHCMLAYSCINCSLELINLLKTTYRIALIMKTTHYHFGVLCCDLMKNTLKNNIID